MTFVNKDAEWLLELSNATELREQERIRLALIAQRLEDFDERLRNLSSMTAHSDGKTYADGVRDAMIRYYSRSNLPIQSVALDPEVATAMQRTSERKKAKVTKVPTGVTAEEFRKQKERNALRIVLNLDKIKLEI